MDAKAKLLRLQRIQELALEVRNADKIVTEAPTKIEEIEQRFRERNAEYVAVKERCDELNQDHDTRSDELANLEEQRDKYMADLNQVKNQREYAAMLKEIDAVKAEISGHEEAILRDLEGLETLREELKSHEEHIVRERETVSRERAEVEAQSEAARAEIESLSRERSKIEEELPATLIKMVVRLEESRQGVFLSKADNGTCLSCFVRIRPQMFQEIRQALEIHSCANCRRFLYYEPSLKPAEATESSDASESSDAGPGVEAVNGGAA